MTYITLCPKDKSTKKILNKSWFMINEQQFALYKRMHNVVVELNKAWYKAFAGTYSDDLIVLIAFLEFMSHFEKLEDLKCNIDMQGEYFNAYACQSLSNYYIRMRNKLSIEPIGNTSKEYFLNQRGAKVYYDLSKQPKLEFENSSLVCDVLAIGFSREMIPLVTIVQAKEIKCYRLPIDLAEWAMTLVGFANMGENMFPSKVMFSHTRGRCYADIL